MDERALDITVGGEYCFDLTAPDDDIVEDEERYTIFVFLDGVIQESTLPIIVIDNDGKENLNCIIVVLCTKLWCKIIIHSRTLIQKI